MKKTILKKIIVGLSAGLLAFSSMAFAADKADKIGFVDGAKIIAKYEPQIDTKLQKELKPMQDKLVALQKKLVDENDQYKRDAATMSPDKVKELQATFDKDQTEFQRMSGEFNQKRSTRANEELEKLLTQVREAAAKISATDGYTIVLQRGAAIYVKDNTADITDKVLGMIQYN